MVDNSFLVLLEIKIRHHPSMESLQLMFDEVNEERPWINKWLINCPRMQQEHMSATFNLLDATQGGQPSGFYP